MSDLPERLTELASQRGAIRGQSIHVLVPSEAIFEAATALSALTAERDALLREFQDLSDPDFLLGAMHNVRDMDTSLEEYARAASRAIRAALDYHVTSAALAHHRGK